MGRTNDPNSTSNSMQTQLYLSCRTELDEYLKSLPTPKSGQVRVFRGQTRDYGTLIPSSLRGDRNTQNNQWFRTYSTLLASYLHEVASEELDELSAWVIWTEALAQHYSIGSPYLDVTKDVEVAMWFATHLPEAHRELLVFGPSGIFNPLTDFPLELEFMTFRPSSERSGYLYVLDVPLWDGEGHPEHGELIDLNQAPAVFADAPRIQAQVANLVYAERSRINGDLSSLLVVPPIEVSAHISDAYTEKRTRDVFPPPSSDPWYEALVSTPVGFYTPDNRHLSPRLSVPVGMFFDTHEDLDQLKRQVTMLAHPLLGPYLRSEQKQGEKWLHAEAFPEDAINLIVNDPLYFVTPPLGDGWNEAIIMTDLPSSARVCNPKPGESDVASLRKVLVEFSPLEYGFWRGLESRDDVRTIRRALYVERHEALFRVWDFTQKVPEGPVTCFGPLPFRFDSRKKMFILGDNLCPVEHTPVIFKNFLLVLKIIRGLSVRPVASPIPVVTSDEGSYLIELQGGRTLVRTDCPQAPFPIFLLSPQNTLGLVTLRNAGKWSQIDAAKLDEEIERSQGRRA